MANGFYPWTGGGLVSGAGVGTWSQHLDGEAGFLGSRSLAILRRT